MERQHNKGDFEKLLRDNANQYRMYPSEKVWKGIHSALHTRRRWYGITTALMFLITSSVVSIIIYNGSPERNNLKDHEIITPANSEIAAIEKPTPQKFTPGVFTPGINKSTPGLKKINNTEQLVHDNPVFNLPGANEEKLNANTGADRIVEINPEDIVWIFIPSTTESSIGEPVIIDPNLVKFDAEIKPENAEGPSLSTDNTISDQDLLNIDTENKIKEALSILASQNAPLTSPDKRARVTAQVFFTPTVSYRKLEENKRVNNTQAYYVPVIDLDNMVKHKPAMGLEFGIEGRYRVNDKFSIKSGFQFNINRYDIRAYTHPKEIASVALNSGTGFDTLSTETYFRNNANGGPNSSWLENFYFQAGFPVGVELILSDNKNLQWGVSGTIQPTYVIGDRAYLLSTDYKNYARFPEVRRRWNISSGIGTFVSYSTGKIKWQVGPHVRYQHLSSFVSELTVKEKLFAVGLKVGASLNKQ